MLVVIALPGQTATLSACVHVDLLCYQLRTCPGLPRNDAASRSRVLPKCLLANLIIQLVCCIIITKLINFCVKVHLVLLHSQVLLPTTMPTLVVALAPSFWMTWCVVDLKQESSTVQGFLVRELGPMTLV